MAKHTRDELRQWQALPLNLKIRMTEERIRMWVREYGEDGVYISFSGGKDSTVLLDIVRRRMGYTDVPAVFSDTGLEYPEIRNFVKTFENVVWLKPKMQFRQVIEKYGYPMFSKETSEVVWSAKKYLTKLAEQNRILQTDRQTDLPYAYRYDRLCGQGKYAKSVEGGADTKYRKLRGLGEFSREQRQMGNAVQSEPLFGNVRNVLAEEEKGHYP